MPLGAIIGVGGSLLSGLLNKKSAKSQSAQSWDQTLQMRRVDRRFTKELRDNERNYLAKKTKQDRRYAEKLATKTRDEQRKHDAAVLKDNRQYVKTRLKKDIAQYEGDRDFMQDRSNELAEKSAASRGVDFQRLRDDAIAAGYNPMTAMNMAHAYSTHVDYNVQGAPYSPGASYQALGAQGGGAGAGGGGGGMVGSHLPAGGGAYVGGQGYSGGQFNPALSSGGFISEAFQRAADTWSNQAPETDPLADALRGALRQNEMADQVRSADISRSFGYDLTEVQPFKPSIGVGEPPMASKMVKPAANMPTGEIEKGGRRFTPIQKPDGSFGKINSSIARRLDLQPFDQISPGDWAEIVGEIGEIETGLLNDRIRKSILDQDLFGNSLGPDFIDSGTQSYSPPLSRNPSPKPGWMQEFFQ